CALLNVPLGLGESLHGVANILSLPTDLSGAPVDAKVLHESLVESIIENDEAMMERYFEGEVPSTEELTNLMTKAIAEGTLTPIICVSTKKDVGLKELLDLLATVALPPTAVQRK